MRNIFFFIRRYFNFLTFLLLQVLCIYFIVNYSKYHQAMFGGSANQVTGRINKEYDKVEYYFRLRKTNDSLVRANEILYNKLRSNFNLPDSTVRSVIDTIRIDSILQYRNFNYLHAKVVSNSVSAQNNFFVINGLNVRGLKAGLSVVDVNDGAAGVITEVDGDYAVVMSLLHKDSKINGKLLKSGETGTVSWDGKQPNILTLTGIAKSAKVVKGDTIITSGASVSFPKGIMIGTVDEVFAEKSTSNFRITLRSSANFYNLEYIY
ncbi:MAG: rod shape-determining protein MreC, partial [Pedobacter sp.]